MSTKRTFALIALLSVACILVVYGFNREIKTFGITGIVQFEGGSSQGAIVFYSTDDKPPALDEINIVKENLEDNGEFYRPINELDNNDVNIWIYKEGYPLVHTVKVLNGNKGNIDFGIITIPREFRKSPEKVVQVNNYFVAFDTQCAEKKIVTDEVDYITNYTKPNSSGVKSCNIIQGEVYRATFVKGDYENHQKDYLFFGI